MPLVVALTANRHEIFWPLRASSLVRSVVHFEAAANSAVFTEAASAIERDLTTMLPSFGPEVLPILPLALFPRFDSPGSRPRLDNACDGAQPRDRRQDQDYAQRQVDRGLHQHRRLLV